MSTWPLGLSWAKPPAYLIPLGMRWWTPTPCRLVRKCFICQRSIFSEWCCLFRQASMMRPGCWMIAQRDQDLTMGWPSIFSSHWHSALCVAIVIAPVGFRGKAVPCNQPTEVTVELQSVEGRIWLRKPTSSLEIFCNLFSPNQIPYPPSSEALQLRCPNDQSLGRPVTWRGAIYVPPQANRRGYNRHVASLQLPGASGLGVYYLSPPDSLCTVIV